MGADADDLEARVGARRHPVGARGHRAAHLGGFRGGRVDEEPAASLGEGLELGPERVDLAVVAADVVDQAERRVIAGEGPVGLAGLRGHRTAGGPQQEARAAAFARQGRAAQHRRGQTRLASEPPHHPGDRALAARARDGHAGAARVHDLGQQGRPRDALDPVRARGAHLRRLCLDRRRVHEPVEAGGDRGAVLWPDRDAERGEAVGDLAILALVEGPVGALHVVTAGSHELRQWIHPRAGDAREVIAHVSWSHGSRRLLTRIGRSPVADFRPPEPGEAPGR